ncbi:Fc receptor-like protein 3 isoform X2 [Antennarius striatus]|uniref:Fc receptor-like protein 3 isoform X2 n=1 Tax=Antennarius striatus TaxID=241820 RepID=UPI0035B244DD
MRPSDFCVLEFISLATLVCFGYAQVSVDPVLSIEPNWSTFFTGESVSFVCDMREGADTNWYYKILKNNYLEHDKKTYRLGPLATSDTGNFHCRGDNKRSYSRKESNKVSLTVTDADVILVQPASVLYEGESVSLHCRRREQGNTKNVSFYKSASLIGTQLTTNGTASLTVQSQSDGSSYTCKFDEGEESKPLKLKLDSRRPKATLISDRRYIPVGGNMTLMCLVTAPSSGWRYFWYRGKKTHEPVTSGQAIFLSDVKIIVSQGGVYWCRGGRGEPVYYTDYSEPIVTSRSTVALQTSWSEIYLGEMITLTCEIEGGEDTEWEYEWVLPSSSGDRLRGYMIRHTPTSLTEYYSCKGKMKSETAQAEWSDYFAVNLYKMKPVPVLHMSTSWPSPGASVTLTCEVRNPSAGWRFYWMEVLFSVSGNTHKLLPGGENGTKQNSYTVGEREFTSAYLCKAGRGNPVFYTDNSQMMYVWSVDMQSGISLTVSPNRSQHLTEESVSLSCTGNSTKWMVVRFGKDGYRSRCTTWGKMTGNTCSIRSILPIDGVFLCASETGQLSNAVNITTIRDIILMSPVYPVAEGDPVTLGCKVSTGNKLTRVYFYKNGILLQNNTETNLAIPAASKSDEGFYKCEVNGGKKLTSRESWMSVKCSCCSRSIWSQRTNQSSDTDHMTTEDETLRKDASLFQDNFGEVTYSSVVLRNISRKVNKETDDTIIYSNMKTGEAAGNSNSDGETIYSQVRTGAASDQ